VKVCVIGEGGREHALATVLRRSAEVVVTRGNPGIPGSVVIDPLEHEADLFVVGPEQPLVEGIADRLRAKGKVVFGPGADGARLEGSKAWMKQVLVEAGVPTARHGAFTETRPALDFLASLDGLYVVKTDGLAAGKGVLVTDDRAEAEADVRAKLTSGGVVIEEGLTGPEVSVLAVCDGTTAVPLAPAQDHKRVGDGDQGPNTGGMGAYSPVPVAPGTLVDDVMERAVLPTLHHLRAQGIDYRGVLYAGLMLTPSGPKMLEYNVRFGDPEAQVVLPRMSSDLAELLLEAANGRLRSEPAFVDDAAVTVVCASEGYPGSPRLGDVIEGIAEAEARLTTSGGRVLDVTALGPTIAEARRRAYDAVSRISWPGMHHRSDIAASSI
jgi:phosphoribosylamine---glycine ligase